MYNVAAEGAKSLTSLSQFFTNKPGFLHRPNDDIGLDNDGFHPQYSVTVVKVGIPADAGSKTA